MTGHNPSWKTERELFEAEIAAQVRRSKRLAAEPMPDLMELLSLFAECLESVMERLERLEAKELLR